ncbi:DUF3367 domain-containing protein [Candidatus Woesebacteria bacterium]|nr:MAG: DUF3367 domain-containing protein [Candidatus Woesebacteria bacterium]
MKQIIKEHWLTIIMFAMSLTPLLWFVGRPDVIINGLDTNFPLDPLVWFERRFFVWNDTIGTGADATTSTSGWFFHLIQVIPHVLGFNLRHVQIISLVFWFSSIVFGSYYLSRTFLKNNKLAQLILVFIYTYNIYLFNTWENVKVANLAVMVGLPLFIGLANRYVFDALSNGKLLFYSVLFSMITSGAGINPAYIITLMGGVIIYFLTILPFRKREIRHIFLGAMLMSVVIIMSNLYWVVPFSHFMLADRAVLTLENIGYTNWVAALSENTSLLNVIRLQGAWDWYAVDQSGFPMYIPYALNYFYKLPFILFSFVVPTLVIISYILLNNKKNYLYVYTGIMLVIGIFMGAGLHEPTGSLYNLMAKYIPYFSFFRSPWYIFTPYVILAYAVLSGLLVENILKRFGDKKILNIILGKRLIYLGVVIFVIGGLLYEYPLITGKIFRPQKSDSFFVKIPDYVWETKKYLDNSESSARIVVYPEDELEQFKWGYRGTETVLNLFSSKETVAPSFVFLGKGLKPILQGIYNNIKQENYDSVFKSLSFLNADTLFMKNDAVSIYHSKEIPEKDKLVFGEWTFYQNADYPGKILTANGLYTNNSDDSVFDTLLPYLDPNRVITLAGDSEVNKIDNSQDIKKNIFQLDNTTYGSNPVGNRQRYLINVPEGIYELAIEKRGYNGSDLSVIFPDLLNKDTEIVETDTFYILKNIKVTQGEHNVDIVYPENSNLISKDLVLKGNENLHIKGEELLNNDNVLIVFNDGINEKSLIVPVDEFNPYANYLFSYEYKYIYGNTPNVNIVQESGAAKYKVLPTKVDEDTDWNKKEIFVEPVRASSTMNVVIEIPVDSREKRSKTYFENISFKRIYDNKLFLIEQNADTIHTPTVSFTKVNPTKYKVKVENINDNYLLVFLEKYSPNWNIVSASYLGKPLHFSAHGYANAWYMPGNSTTQEFTIFYTTQKYYYFGLFVSLATVVICVLIFPLYNYVKRSKKVHK